MMTKYRSVVLLFALLLLGLTACGGEKTKKEVDHPTVRLQAGDKTYEEKVFSYCWPESAANVVCKTNYDVREQPAKSITVAAGDSIHLLVDEKYGTPQQVTTTLLDGPGGQQALGSTTDGIYPVALENGAYRIQVDVTYADVQGRQTYVSYIFGLNVQGGSIAALPSPTPVVVVPTEEPTEIVTAEPTKTISPTETSVPQQTAEPTEQPVIKPTQTKTPLQTSPAGASETPAAGAVRPTATQNGVQPTATRPAPTATRLAPTSTIPPSVKPPTATVVLEVPPTATASQVVPTQTPPAVQPTATPITETQPQVVTATLITVPPTVPSMTLNFAGRSFTAVGYQYCQRQASGENICVELPAESINPSRITLQRGAAVQLQIEGARPSEVRIEYLSDTGVSTGQPETKRGDNIILFSVMPEPGTYILAIRVTWQNVDATYYFRVAVSD